MVEYSQDTHQTGNVFKYSIVRRKMVLSIGDLERDNMARWLA